jgi:UDP-N-acetylmuramyl pentapeptide synthase
MDTVLGFLADADAPRKVLVLGTISDYAGERSRTYMKVARRALEVADEVVFVGPNAPSARKLATLDGSVRSFGTVREAADHFGRALQDGDLVLVKGSNRADHLVRIILARTTRVRCWRESCGRHSFCEDCWLLRVP